MFCSKCGQKNEDTTNFCIKCGNNLHETSSGIDINTENIAANVEEIKKKAHNAYLGYVSSMSKIHKNIFFLTLIVFVLVQIARFLFLPDWSLIKDDDDLKVLKDLFAGGYATMTWTCISILVIQAISLKTRFIKTEVFVAILAIIIPFFAFKSAFSPIVYLFNKIDNAVQEASYMDTDDIFDEAIKGMTNPFWDLWYDTQRVIRVSYSTPEAAVMQLVAYPILLFLVIYITYTIILSSGINAFSPRKR